MDPWPDIARSKDIEKEGSRNAAGVYKKQTQQNLKAQAREVSRPGMDRGR
jgi:hypothetical protein